MSNQNIILSENRQVRRYYDSENEIWYFSIVDILEALTKSVNPTDYLKKLRKRDKELGTYIGTNCPQVEMLSNRKKRKTLAGNAEDIFRLIQSIPSPKAEPFKQWLAKIIRRRFWRFHQQPSLIVVALFIWDLVNTKSRKLKIRKDEIRRNKTAFYAI